MLRYSVVPFPAESGRLAALRGPGVYLFFVQRVSALAGSMQGEASAVLGGLLDGSLPAPLYVGKAKSLKTRLACYLGTGAADASRLRGQARSVLVLECDTHFLACLLEITLIRRLSPPFNSASTVASRSIFFAREGDHVRITSSLPPIATTCGFSSSKIQVKEWLTTLAAVARSLDGKVPFSLFHGKHHGEQEVFSPRAFFFEEAEAHLLTGYLAGRPKGFLARVEARMREEAGREDFEAAVRWRDALFVLARFSHQLSRSRRILRRHRAQVVFECGQVRVMTQGFEVLSIALGDGEVLMLPLLESEGKRERNLTRRLRIHYEHFRLMDSWLVREDEDCRILRRSEVPRPCKESLVPGPRRGARGPRSPRRHQRSDSHDTDLPEG